MKRRHLGRKLKRAIVMVLTVALLASDNTILYAAEAFESAEVQQENDAGTDSAERQGDGNTAAVSGGDADGGAPGEEEFRKDDENTSGAVEVTPGEEGEGDTSDAADNADVFGDSGTVSGGDAAAEEDAGTITAETHLPEQFYEEEKQEAYGTLVSFDEYSRTYHVDGSQYVTVVGNDGATFIDDDSNLMPVDNTLERETAGVYSMFGGEQEAGYVNRANDYMVLLPEFPV